MSVRKRSWKNADGAESVVWIADVTDATGHRERRQFSSRKEAEAYRVSVEGQMHSGTFRGGAAKVTVKDASVTYLKYCEGRRDRGERMTRKHYDVMDGHVWNYICPDAKRHEDKKRPARLKTFEGGISAIKLSQLRPRSVNDFRDELRKAGVSVVTTRKILSTLQQILAYAVGQDMVGTNAAQGVEVIGRRDEGAKKIVPPSKEFMRALLTAADQDFKVKLSFASTSGVRAGELHALRWRHLNFSKAEANIETRVDSYGDEDTTKTAAGVRDIPLAQLQIVMLKEWKLRSKHKKDDDLVFPSKAGTYTGHDNMMKRKFWPLVEKLAAKHIEDPEHNPAPPADFNWHALRHFAISCWIEADLKPKTVQTFAGHSSLQVTMDRYGHLFKSDDHKKAMDAIAAEMLA